jgi:hypothetical protein
MHNTCLHCSKLFTPVVGSYGKFCSLSCSNFYRANEQRTKKKLEYNKNPKKCKNCSISLLFDKRMNMYCSHSCSAKSTNCIPRRRGPIAKNKPKYSTIKFMFCEFSKQWYSNRNPDGSFCRISPYIKTAKEQYYSAARFRFNVYNYPDEFDLKLIDTVGWYTCPGKKRKNDTKNIYGVSRDHIISVSYGFKYGIDPKIISHPANCRIMLHSDNKKKSDSSDLTVDQLLVRIKQWNEKYIEQATRLELATSGLEDQYSTN